MIEFVKLYEAENEEDKETYFQEVIAGLSKDEKDTPDRFIYDKIGSEQFSRINFLQAYYLSKSEKEVFSEQGSDILSVIGKEKFNLVELGAGDGLKTKILIQKAVSQEYSFEYIPIDISHGSNLELAENIRNISDKIDMTILTAEYQSGLKWVSQNKKDRNVFCILGCNFGSYYNHQIKKFMTEMKPFLKKGDMVIIGLDMIKSIPIIEKAYSAQEKLWQEFNMNILARINRQLEGTFNLQKFYSHTYFDPIKKCVMFYMISSCEQTVKVRDKEFHLKDTESIFFGISRKFSQNEIEELTINALDVKLVKFFDDKNKYFRENIFIKQ